MKIEIEIINYTPHDVNYQKIDGEIITFKSKGNARMRTQQYKQIMIGDFAMVLYEDNGVEGLPEPKTGKLYIVSSIVQTKCSNRDDLITPCQFNKDNSNFITSCRGFRF